MFLRLVQVKIKAERLMEYFRVYEQQIIPQLQQIEGCQYAALLQSVQNQEEGMSVTLWDTQTHAEAYEKSGAYRHLVEMSKPFFSDSAEFKVQLTKDLELEYTSVPQEPVVTAYTEASSLDTKPLAQERRAPIYIRIVSMRVNPAKMEEFKEIFHRDIIPALRRVPGCLLVYLVESVHEKNVMLSLTIWNSLAEARAYEAEGSFAVLLGKLKHTFSDLSQWKMDVDKEHGQPAVTSDDVSVNAYNVVVSKMFR